MDVPQEAEEVQVRRDAVAGLEADGKTVKRRMDLERQTHSHISTSKTKPRFRLWTTRLVAQDEAQDSGSSGGEELEEVLVVVVEVPVVELVRVATDAISLVSMVEEVGRLEVGIEGDGKTGKRCVFPTCFLPT